MKMARINAVAKRQMISNLLEEIHGEYYKECIFSAVKITSFKLKLET